MSNSAVVSYECVAEFSRWLTVVELTKQLQGLVRVYYRPWMLEMDKKKREWKMCARPIFCEMGENYLEGFESGRVPIFQVITETEHICFYAHKLPTGLKSPYYFVNQLGSFCLSACYSKQLDVVVRLHFMSLAPFIRP